jgi:hypothetical protein
MIYLFLGAVLNKYSLKGRKKRKYEVLSKTVEKKKKKERNNKSEEMSREGGGKV